MLSCVLSNQKGVPPQHPSIYMSWICKKRKDIQTRSFSVAAWLQALKGNHLSVLLTPVVDDLSAQDCSHL